MRVLVALLLLVCLSRATAQTVVNPDANNVFHVTAGNSQTGYTIGGVLAPTLNMTADKTYWISIEFDSATQAHPFGFHTVGTGAAAVSALGLQNVNGTCGTGGIAPANSYTSNGTVFCVLSFQPTTATPQPLYYRCAIHQAMVGQVQVVGGAAGGSTTAPPTNATTAPPTNAPTNAPTNPPKNIASGVVPGAAMVVFAAIAAVMA